MFKCDFYKSAIKHLLTPHLYKIQFGLNLQPQSVSLNVKCCAPKTDPTSTHHEVERMNRMFTGNDINGILREIEKSRLDKVWGDRKGSRNAKATQPGSWSKPSRRQRLSFGVAILYLTFNINRLTHLFNPYLTANETGKA